MKASSKARKTAKSAPSRKGRKPTTTETKQAAPQAREAILAAALSVFAREGYNGASMPKIAQTANVGAPLIHYYFQSKENLWKETVAYSLADLHRDVLAIASVTATLKPMDQLRVFIQTVTRHAAHWPDNFVMIIAEARSQSERFSWIQQHYTGVIFDSLQTILNRAKTDKLIKKNINTEQLTTLLIGGILVYFTAHTALRQNNKEEAVEKLATEYTDMICQLLN